jgi:hypothetical protein
VPFQLQPFNKKTILIGAGFSRNWGGRLAREMWEDIFSNRAVQSRSATRALMLRNPFFEDALAEVLDTKLYLDEDRAALNSAIQDAFERMDSEHAAKFASGQPAIDLGGMKDLIARFRAPAHNNVGYVFSLNQDVLFERLVSHWPDIQCRLPGVRGLPPATPLLGTPPLAYPATPDLTDPRLDGALNYCKLHGSFQWRPADGTPGVVVGSGKEIAIGRSPLLTEYYALFKSVLCAGDVRLLVIGYGFGDAHINKVISTAVQSYGAKLFVWDTANPLELVSNVNDSPSDARKRIDLRPYLCGAASRTFATVVPWGEHPTPEFKRIADSFFG